LLAVAKNFGVLRNSRLSCEGVFSLVAQETDKARKGRKEKLAGFSA
jgi:hypothetical protein